MKSFSGGKNIMKLGIHAYEWCSTWSNDTLDIIDTVRSLGFDFIEIPLMRLDLFDPEAVKERLDGFEVTTSNVLLKDEVDITSFDESNRKRGVQYLKDCVKASVAAGAKVFSGVIYSKYLKEAKCMPTQQEWEFSANALREVARFAADLGISIGLEPVTRYESYLLNISEQAVRLVDMVGEPNIFVHLDSYHMNVEEKNFYQAVKTAGEKLKYFHLCENDRGIVGQGHVDWDGIFRAFKEIGFDGYVAFEGFSDCTDNMSTWVWRKLAPDGETYVRESMKFTKEMIRKYGL
jgi:D-psicose/D-tagatose/L-ribulose 3-epimerase